MAYEVEIRAAIGAAHEAARVVMDQYAALSPIHDAPASISTSADRAAQESILASLAATFPNDAYRAEEATPRLAALPHTGPRIWIVDPIDGTRGFARKNGEFSIMIALVEDGVAVVGVVHEPAKKRLTYAIRGDGCWLRDGQTTSERAQVSASACLNRLTLTQSHSNPKRPPPAAVRLLEPQKVLETYSAGIKLAQVARGEADLYVCDYDAMNDWDIAAGLVLVEEAGGRVTTRDGQPMKFGRTSPIQTGGLLATNGRIHDAVVAKLNSPG
jgi:3'(2'), 5'-bisphosphate nucleotidase